MTVGEDNNKGGDGAFGPEQWLRYMEAMSGHGRKMAEIALQRLKQPEGEFTPDPLNLFPAYNEMTRAMLKHPDNLRRAQAEWMRDGLELWGSMLRRMQGERPEPVIAPEKGDKRFADPVWSEHFLFDFLKQSYLLTARWMQDAAGKSAEEMNGQDAHKIAFYTKQFADALSPSNFLSTNPEVLRETLESRGENLLRGMENLMRDLERGKGKLRISMTDPKAFELGRDIAVTPGKVIFRNEMMELIQYAPSTEDCFRAPLLVIPPWINKFYILDLRPKNSFIRWATSQGHTVFVISWVNPDAALAERSFDDYMTGGPLAALDAIEKATGEKRVNALGYCLGGTLLASMLAWMAADGGETDSIISATFLTTLVDFTDAGDLSVFIDDAQLENLDRIMEKRGYLDGSEMANVFNMLRANDLIWSFVVNNYLMGKQPPPFDLLYWNADATRLPAKMHSFYLHNMYRNNLLAQPAALTMNGRAIDLGKITVPCFLLSTHQDHIAPWKSTYAAMGLYNGPVRFTLAESGHIAGVINPPPQQPTDRIKYGYWTNDAVTADPEQWFQGATHHAGSWWPEWARWLAPYGGDKIPAREPGTGGLKPLGDAPGEYVRVRAG